MSEPNTGDATCAIEDPWLLDLLFFSLPLDSARLSVAAASMHL